MTILLDTQCWLWSLLAPERLSDHAQDLLKNRDNRVLFSAASGWEIAIKYAIGKLPLPQPPASFVPERLARDGIETLPVLMSHALHVSELPTHHRDPFDRLLIAQSRLDGVPLLTADPVFARYDVQTVAAGRG